MAKIDIVLEIESILRQEKPNERRLKQLRVKLLEPKENDRVKAILAKQSNATVKELKILVNKGVTRKDIAKNTGMRMEDLSKLLGTSKAGKIVISEEEIKFHAEELNKDTNLYLRKYAEEVGYPEHTLREGFKKYGIKILPRNQLSDQTLKAIELLNNDPKMTIAEASRQSGAGTATIRHQVRVGRIKR